MPRVPLPGALTLLAVSALPALAQDAAPYRILDNDEGAWIDLVTPAVRPMVLHPTTKSLWATNSHDSTLVELAPDGTRLRTVRLPWGPVAVAHWAAEGEGDSLLVVCRNSQSLVRVESATGALLSLVQLGSQSGGAASTLFQRTHTVLLTNLRTGGFPHDVTIDVTDLGGNAVQVSPGTIQTGPIVNVPSMLFRNATATEVKDSGGTLHQQISGVARRKGGAKQANRAVRVNVFVNGQLTQEGLQGSTSGGDGLTTVDVVENGLLPGDVVTVVVMSLHDVGANFGGDWSMPDTLPEHRSFVFEYTGQGL